MTVATLVLTGILVTAKPAPAIGESGQAESPDPITKDHPWIGELAPEFVLTSTSGESIALTGFRGKKFLVIHFAASW